MIIKLKEGNQTIIKSSFPEKKVKHKYFTIYAKKIYVFDNVKIEDFEEK